MKMSAWAMAMILAGGRLATASEQGVWDAVSEPFRRREVSTAGLGGAPRRANISIEAGERRNPFLIPGTHEEMLLSDKKKSGKSGKKTAGVKEISAKDARPLLEEFEGNLARAEKAFDQGRFSELPAKDIPQWPGALEKFSVEKPEDAAFRADLVERSRSLAARVAAREAFLQRAYTVHFVVVHEGAPERSVASIGGKIVRTGDAFDDGVVAKTIRKDGVVVTYKGLTFALPLLRMAR